MQFNVISNCTSEDDSRLNLITFYIRTSLNQLNKDFYRSLLWIIFLPTCNEFSLKLAPSSEVHEQQKHQDMVIKHIQNFNQGRKPLGTPMCWKITIQISQVVSNSIKCAFLWKSALPFTVQWLLHRSAMFHNVQFITYKDFMETVHIHVLQNHNTSIITQKKFKIRWKRCLCTRKA